MSEDAPVIPQYIGARVQRVEDPRLLRGRGRYLDDLSVPGMLHAAFVRSPFAHARILGIETEAARAHPGVVAVFTGHDIADSTLPMTTALGREEVKAASHHALPTDKVRHVGDPVVVVVAETRYIAEDAAALVEVDWEPLPPVVDPEAALAPDAPLLDESLGDNNIAHIEGGVGEVEAAFASAARVFRKRFRGGRSTAAALEPRGLLVDYEPSTGDFKMWSSTQSPHLIRTLLAPLLKANAGQLTIHAPDVGGGFGLKSHVFPEDIAIPAASRLLARPVKWVSDRNEDLAAGVHSKDMIVDFEIAVDEEGRFTAMRGHFITDGGAYSVLPFTPLVDSLIAATAMSSVYDVSHLHYTVDNPLTNKCQIGAVRGVGWTPAQIGRELLIDEVARGLGQDPVELRLKNMISSEPQRLALGGTTDGGSYRESVEAAAETIGYAGFRARQTELREQGRYLGIGFSPFIELSGLSSAASKVNGFDGATYHDRASVAMEPDGTVIVTTGLHSHGQGHETTFAQVAADRLGVLVEDVRVRFGDTERDAYGMGTYASRSAVVGTGTIHAAATEVRSKVVRLARALLEASPEDIELGGGFASLKGAPVRRVAIREVAGFGYFGDDARPALDMGELDDHALIAHRSYEAPETYSNGCCAVIAEVDVATGIVTLERVVAVEDCGVMLNPMIVEGQVRGAVAQAIGAALYEEAAYDEEGQFLSGSLMDYLYPSAAEVPEIEVVHIETPSTVTAGGVKGMGEAGMICAPAAVAGAVADALSPFGVSIDRTPLTPTYLRDLLREAGA